MNAMIVPASYYMSRLQEVGEAGLLLAVLTVGVGWVLAGLWAVRS